MTNKEAIDVLKANYPDSCYELLREAVDTAIEALKEPKARCLNCDFLKNCIHAWTPDCGCEFYQVNGVRPWIGEK